MKKFYIAVSYILVLGLSFMLALYLYPKINKAKAAKANSEPKKVTEPITIDLTKEPNLVITLNKMRRAKEYYLGNIEIINKNNYNVDETLYQNKTITLNDLDDEDKVRIAFAYNLPSYANNYYFGESYNRYLVIDDELSKNVYTESGTFSEEEYNNYLNDNYGISSKTPILLFDVNYDYLNKSYQEIFGYNNEMPKASFSSLDGSCLYSSKINDYICYQTSTDYLSVGGNYSAIEKAIKYEDYVEIYDYYLQFKGESGIKIDNIEKETIKQGVYYKHTFKQNKDGTYYWYSSEPVKETKEQEETPSENKNLIKYMGAWDYSDNDDDKVTDEIIINSITNDSLNFDYFVSPGGSLDEVSCELKGNKAEFLYEENTVSIKGTITLNNNSITLNITDSNYKYIPVGTIELKNHVTNAQLKK